jgi:mannose-1-phosphate guanylyltransferase
MQAVILVGGEGTRLRPLTETIPKPMIPVLNRPFLEHALQHLRTHSIDEAFLALGYLPDIIEAHFGNGADIGISLQYSQEHKPMGTAGAIKLLQKHLKSTFIVCNGDIFTNLDITKMLSFHRERKAKTTIFLTPVENPSAFGAVETDHDGRVCQFLEKPAPSQVTSNWINGGIYLLEPEVLEAIPRDHHFMFERGLFPHLVDSGVPVYGYKDHPYWLDMGTPQSYLRLHNDLLYKNSLEDPINYIQKEADCEIKSDALIKGPVLLGRGCLIENKVTIQGPVTIGSNCHIKANTSIANSVIWSETTVGTESVIEKSIVGRNVQIGSRVTIGEGSILADGVIVSDGTSIGPGSTFGPKEQITNLTNHSADTTFKGRK